jgi:parallel beta-helix repeat protein
MYRKSLQDSRCRTRAVTTAALVALFGGASALCFASGGPTTYYVSPSGQDTNSGTSAAPFRQIRQALTVVQPGDTVLVADGSYLGFDVNSINGTATAPITIKATGTGAKVTVTTDRSDNRDTIFVTLSSYIVIDGLTSFNANRSAIRVDQSPNVTIQNCVFGNNTTWGIFTDFSDNLLIQNNECYGSQQQHGIYVSNSTSNPIVRGNLVHDNYDCGIQFNGDGTLGGNGLILNALCENNIVYNNCTGGGSGINTDGMQNSVIRNNLLYNNHATGIVLYQWNGNSGPSNDLVCFNTIDMPSDGQWAMNIYNTVGAVTLRNNIMNNASAHGGIQYGTSTDVSNTDSDYNIQSKVTPDGGNTFLSLAAWQSQGHEPHSFTATDASLFVNPSAGNYQLLSTAPAKDKGQVVSGVSYDILGNRRVMGSLPDIGAYEYPVSAAVPSCYRMSQISAAAGSAGFTLTINGSNFVMGSLVQWNGANLATTFSSSTQLSATVPAANLATSGYAVIDVYTPPTGGGTSNRMVFVIGQPNLVIHTTLARSGGNITATIRVSNTGTVAAQSAQVLVAVLKDMTKSASATGSPLPLTLGNIPVNGSATATITFSGSVGATGDLASISIKGAYASGSFSLLQALSLP